LRRAVNAFRGEDIAREQGHRWLWLAGRAAGLLWDNEAAEELSARLVQIARNTGALTLLPWALIQRSGQQLFSGKFATVASLVEEAAAVNEATGSSMAPYAALALVAFQAARPKPPS
jgi:hypothetical protein